jgi:uncharacterized damage-inducible protein DinB
MKEDAMATRRAAAKSPELELLTALVRESYDRTAWHGPNLRAALQGVDARTAFRRPAEGRHSIWELALHTAYWQWAVVRRLTGDRAPFDVRPRGSDFPKGPASEEEATDEAWRADLKLLARQHARLVDAIAGLDPRKLHAKTPGSRQTPALMLRGVACHNLYHAGQIRLLSRLAAQT